MPRSLHTQLTKKLFLKMLPLSQVTLYNLSLFPITKKATPPSSANLTDLLSTQQAIFLSLLLSDPLQNTNTYTSFSSLKSGVAKYLIT